MAAAQAALIGLGVAMAPGQAASPEFDDEGAQVLTRGPVHEAFAGLISYNPEPGVIVEIAPPEAIEEMPPDTRPAGDNIQWIPGYWGWDDEQGGYLWISGTWRALPPGRQWTTGYWNTVDQGYQWISGYWADASLQETTYLPKPPLTVESGPNVEAPSQNHSWSPGSWMWSQERYAWRPGYWAEGRSDWDWIPDNYVWTPRGYVYVDGYWDYSFDRRGVVYAPVRFQPSYYSRPGYSYTPVIAIGLAAIVENLFLRPNYHHYYFGDYYDRGYRDRGYYSPHVYQSNRYGYDPVYSHRRWIHRDDRNWERRDLDSYDYRRDHQDARPPRTWAEQRKFTSDRGDSRARRMQMGAPLDQMSKQSDRPLRIERVATKERQKYAELSRDVRKTREQRRVIETQAVKNVRGETGQDFKPTKVRSPKSPIIGRSRDQFDKKQAPPETRRSPIVEPKTGTPDRKTDTERNRPQAKATEGPKRETRPQPKATEPKRETRPQPKVMEPKRETRPQPKVTEPKRETRPQPKATEPKRETRPQPKATEPKRETRPQPKVVEPKRETRPQPKDVEPKRETRPQPKATEPKRETRPQPKATEPKRETRTQSRQPGKNSPLKLREQPKAEPAGRRTVEPTKPSSPSRSKSDKEESEQSRGKAQKKERE
jgi:hypothetical protein